MDAAKRWIDSEFQPSTLSKDDQMKELQWFAKAAEPEMGGRHLAMMMGAIIESKQTFEATVHAYGPSSGSGNYVISLLARGGQS